MRTVMVSISQFIKREPIRELIGELCKTYSMSNLEQMRAMIQKTKMWMLMVKIAVPLREMTQQEEMEFSKMEMAWRLLEWARTRLVRILAMMMI